MPKSEYRRRAVRGRGQDAVAQNHRDHLRHADVQAAHLKLSYRPNVCMYKIRLSTETVRVKLVCHRMQYAYVDQT